MERQRLWRCEDAFYCWTIASQFRANTGCSPVFVSVLIANYIPAQEVTEASGADRVSLSKSSDFWSPWNNNSAHIWLRRFSVIRVMVILKGLNQRLQDFFLLVLEDVSPFVQEASWAGDVSWMNWGFLLNKRCNKKSCCLWCTPMRTPPHTHKELFYCTLGNLTYVFLSAILFML